MGKGCRGLNSLSGLERSTVEQDPAGIMFPMKQDISLTLVADQSAPPSVFLSEESEALSATVNRNKIVSSYNFNKS
jgi:hypothetical protein